MCVCVCVCVCVRVIACVCVCVRVCACVWLQVIIAKSAWFVTVKNTHPKLQALVYDILPSKRKVPESGARSVHSRLSHDGADFTTVALTWWWAPPIRPPLKATSKSSAWRSPKRQISSRKESAWWDRHATKWKRKQVCALYAHCMTSSPRHRLWILFNVCLFTDTRGSNASTSFTDSSRGLKERRTTSGEGERERGGGGRGGGDICK